MTPIYEIDEMLFQSGTIAGWDEVEKHGITAVISVAEFDSYPPPFLAHYHWSFFHDDIVNGAPWKKVLPIVDLGEHLVRSGERLLVHCSAGLNRSGLINALILLRLHPDWTPDQAIDRVRARRPLRPDEPAIWKYALFNKAFERMVRESIP